MLQITVRLGRVLKGRDGLAVSCIRSTARSCVPTSTPPAQKGAVDPGAWPLARWLLDKNPPAGRPSRPAVCLRTKPRAIGRPGRTDGADGSGGDPPNRGWTATAKTRTRRRLPWLLLPSVTHLSAPARHWGCHPAALQPEALCPGGLDRLPVPQRHRTPDQSSQAVPTHRNPL